MENTIKAKIDKSDYKIYPDFLNFYIDDFWLDEKLDELYPQKNMFKGLIPTLDGSLQIDSEKKVVWDRIFPEEGSISICPILMCPDDCDFTCTLVVAEIYNSGEYIIWKRIGIDNTKEWGAEKVGSTVEWLNKSPQYSFHRSNYLEMITCFEEELI